MLREMRALGRLGPLLWWVGGPASGVHQMLSGFVWLEEGKIVGNVTVTRAPYPGDRWIISNVAVAPPYRGRGIGRRLMEAAIEMVCGRRGRSVALQVRDDNDPALHVYRALGFQGLFGTVHLRLDRVVVPETLPPRDGIRIRPFASSDALTAYRLACAAIDQSAQDEHPVRPAQFEVTVEQRLGDWLRKMAGRMPSLRLVAEGDARLVGIVTVQAAAQVSGSLITLTVHPNARGLIEETLLRHALNHVSRWSHGPVVARHPTFHPAGVAAFRSLGFRTERTLLWMRRDL